MKIKKIVLCLLLVFAFFMTSCDKQENPTNNENGSNNEEVKDVYYSVKFYDQNGNVIDTRQVKEGESIEKTMEDYQTDEYNYSFIGWDKSLENIKSNLEVHPEYEKVKRKYKVEFVLTDELELISGDLVQYVEYGEKAITPEIIDYTGKYEFSLIDNLFIFKDTKIEFQKDNIVRYEIKSNLSGTEKIAYSNVSNVSTKIFYNSLWYEVKQIASRNLFKDINSDLYFIIDLRYPAIDNIIKTFKYNEELEVARKSTTDVFYNHEDIFGCVLEYESSTKLLTNVYGTVELKDIEVFDEVEGVVYKDKVSNNGKITYYENNNVWIIDENTNFANVFLSCEGYSDKLPNGTEVLKWGEVLFKVNGLFKEEMSSSTFEVISQDLRCISNYDSTEEPLYYFSDGVSKKIVLNEDVYFKNDFVFYKYDSDYYCSNSIDFDFKMNKVSFDSFEYYYCYTSEYDVIIVENNNDITVYNSISEFENSLNTIELSYESNEPYESEFNVNNYNQVQRLEFVDGTSRYIYDYKNVIINDVSYMVTDENVYFSIDENVIKKFNYEGIVFDNSSAVKYSFENHLVWTNSNNQGVQNVEISIDKSNYACFEYDGVNYYGEVIYNDNYLSFVSNNKAIQDYSFNITIVPSYVYIDKTNTVEYIEGELFYNYGNIIIDTNDKYRDSGCNVYVKEEENNIIKLKSLTSESYSLMKYNEVYYSVSINHNSNENIEKIYNCDEEIVCLFDNGSLDISNNNFQYSILENNIIKYSNNGIDNYLKIVDSNNVKKLESNNIFEFDLDAEFVETSDYNICRRYDNFVGYNVSGTINYYPCEVLFAYEDYEIIAILDFSQNEFIYEVRNGHYNDITEKYNNRDNKTIDVVIFEDTKYLYFDGKFIVLELGQNTLNSDIEMVVDELEIYRANGTNYVVFDKKTLEFTVYTIDDIYNLCDEYYEVKINDNKLKVYTNGKYSLNDGKLMNYSYASNNTNYIAGIYINADDSTSLVKLKIEDNKIVIQE